MKQSLTKKVRDNPLIRHNLIFFLGSISIGVLNYLYYPVLGRLLHPNTFGEVQALFSLFAQLTIFLNVLGLLTVNLIVNYRDDTLRDRVINELEKVSLLIGVGILGITALFHTQLRHFFHFTSALPFIFLACALVVSIPFMFRNAFLRGKKLFGLTSFAGIVAAACDLIFSIIFVVAGWGTSGAILGLVVAQFVGLWYASASSRKHGFRGASLRSFIHMPNLRLIAPELRYGLLVLIGSLGMTGFYSIDTIIVKHYFNAQTAGLYAGIATIARIIFFLTASVTQVLLPSVTLQQSGKENQKILLKSTLLLVCVGGLNFIVFALAPQLVIHLLMGSSYLRYADLLPRLSLLIFIVSILNLFIMYHIALRRYAVMFIIISGIIVATLLLHAYHQSLQAVINGLLYSSLAMLMLLALWVGVEIFKIKKMEIGGESV